MSKITSRIPILLLLSVSAAAIAQDNRSSPRLELPNPTPRPEDIKQKYESMLPKDASPREVAMRKAQNREQMQKATDMLVMLAQRLRDNPGSTNVAATLAVSEQRASEIEVLAKIVRDRMKLQ